MKTLFYLKSILIHKGPICNMRCARRQIRPPPLVPRGAPHSESWEAADKSVAVPVSVPVMRAARCSDDNGAIRAARAT